MHPLLFSLLCLVFFTQSTGFLSEQLRYTRVRAAFDEKKREIEARLLDLSVPSDSLRLFVRVFKQEGRLEIWVGQWGRPYALYDTIPICLSSGKLGPKRRQGDGQVPEGLYEIDRFNPYSSFHLSLGLNYPNGSDRIRANGNNPGGDIFIHGSCVSIGCIPITDDHIKTLYVLAVLAREAGHDKIEVHVFPFELVDNFQTKYPGHADRAFWEELQPFYRAFAQNKLLPMYYIDSQGRYLMK